MTPPNQDKCGEAALAPSLRELSPKVTEGVSYHTTLHLIIDYGANTVKIMIYIQITESNDL